MKTRDLLIMLQTLALNNPEVLNEDVEVSMYGVDTTFYVTGVDTSDSDIDFGDAAVSGLVLYVK